MQRKISLLRPLSGKKINIKTWKKKDKKHAAFKLLNSFERNNFKLAFGSNCSLAKLQKVESNFDNMRCLLLCLNYISKVPGISLTFEVNNELLIKISKLLSFEVDFSRSYSPFPRQPLHQSQTHVGPPNLIDAG